MSWLNHTDPPGGGGGGGGASDAVDLAVDPTGHTVLSGTDGQAELDEADAALQDLLDTVAAITGANAVVFKGTIDASANPNYPAANAGDLYRISVAGKIGGASGPNVEVGDTVLALVDGLSAGTQAAVGASWDILQVNIDGAVIGPASSIASRLAVFSGTSGKLIADSGVAVSTDGTLVSNSDAKLATEKAVKTYADAVAAAAASALSTAAGTASTATAAVATNLATTNRRLSPLRRAALN